jgi:hypothetical protein
MERETPFTASTTPSGVSKETFRLAISRTGTLMEKTVVFRDFPARV